jgi:hypothetical protein
MLQKHGCGEDAILFVRAGFADRISDAPQIVSNQRPQKAGRAGRVIFQLFSESRVSTKEQLSLPIQKGCRQLLSTSSCQPQAAHASRALRENSEKIEEENDITQTRLAQHRASRAPSSNRSAALEKISKTVPDSLTPRPALDGQKMRICRTKRLCSRSLERMHRRPPI